MKLANLCSSELKKQLYAIAVSPWEKLTPQKRQKLAKSFIIRHRLGEKASKFIRQHRLTFTGDKQLRPREAAEWICANTMALTAEQSYKPMKAFRTSLAEAFMSSGMSEERKQELFNSFDKFQL